MCGIYKITNNINNKCYIGQSIDIEKRWNKHKYATDDFAIHKAIRKYGLQNFSFEVIEECPNDFEVLDEREIFWISYYNSFKEGYNMNEGGSNHIGTLKGKKVYQYTFDGQLIATYISAHEADRQTGIDYSSICNCCRGNQLYAGDYIWRYENSSLPVTPILKRPKTKQETIYCFDEQGNFVTSYPSLAIASQQIGVSKSGICNSVSGKARTAGGYQWSYDRNFNKPAREQMTGKKGKSVAQIDIHTGKVIKIFKTISEAHRETGINQNGIGRVCSGKAKTSGGYYWKFIN